MWQYLVGDLSLNLGVIQVPPGSQRFHDVRHHRTGVLEDIDPLLAVAVDDIIRVHAVRQRGDADIRL